MVWWLTPDIRSRNCILENSQTHWNFQSTSRLFGVCKFCAFLKSPCIKKTEAEIAKSKDDLMISQLITRTERCLQQRDAWCESCVCIEKDSHEFALPRESKCRRATCPERRPILTRNADCLHDLRILSGHRRWWSCTRSIRSFQYKLAEWWRSRFRQDGTKLL